METLSGDEILETTVWTGQSFQDMLAFLAAVPDIIEAMRALIAYQASSPKPYRFWRYIRQEIDAQRWPLRLPLRPS